MSFKSCLTVFWASVLLQVAMAPVGVNAQSISYNGRYIDTEVSPPLLPTSTEECRAYSMEANAIYRELIDAYKQCMDNTPTGPIKWYTCTYKKECEGHCIAKNQFRENYLKNSKACYNAVSLNRAAQAAFDAVTEPSSRSNESSYNNSYPSTSDVLTSSARDAKNIRAKCDRLRSSVDRRACYEGIHDYTDNSRSLAVRSPIIKSIQNRASDTIREHHLETLKELETLEEQIGNLGRDDDWSESWDEPPN